MTFDEQVRALEPLRLTPRQARFVATVALHSGYCLRRQYMAFAGLRYGKVVRGFLETLVARGLATKERCRADRGFLYHLHARSIYRALRQDDNRNRRRASLAAIGRKLMILDFVITKPEVEWYATEEDKVELFTTRFGVPSADFPQQTFTAYEDRTSPTTRYFMHKLPVFLAGQPPVVHFVALAMDPTAADFERFLHDHARLVARLREWTVVVVTPTGASNAEACRRMFERTVGVPVGPVPNRADLIHYFTTRRAVERNELAALSVADLNRFRDARQRFIQPAIETLYAQWLVGGDRVVGDSTAAGGWSPMSTGRFVARQLPFKYEQFGDFAGVC
ncbi:MAG TPA: hypothetical protein VJN96_20950 [Vicinamibacterales bacterium]|nr:hypothetical protein [Vicinamibacterales bacterium]